MNTFLMILVWLGMWHLATLAGKINSIELLIFDAGLAYYIVVLRPIIRARKSKEEDVNDKKL